MSGPLLQRRPRTAEISVPPECGELIRRGALVTLSHSAGKDSQAMTILLSEIVPHDQLVAVHAPLADAVGMRAQESATRARKAPWRGNDSMSVAGREVFDLSTDDVFRVIHDAGQSPHWIYEHLPRCSCAFCIFSSPEQLRCAAELRPELYRRHVAVNHIRRYAALESRIGHTLSPSRVPLTQLTGIPL